MSGEVVPCLSVPCDYEIKDGLVLISAGEFRLCMSLRVFRQCHARATKTLVDFDRHTGEVIRMRGHAAS